MNEVNAVQDSLTLLWGYPITFAITVFFYFVVKIMGLFKVKEEK